MTTEYLSDFLRKAINSEIERVTNEELDKVTERIQQRKAEVIAGVILYVQKAVDMQNLQDRLIVTVRTK